MRLIDTVIDIILIIVFLSYLIQWRKLEKRLVKLVTALLNQNNALTETLGVLDSILSRYNAAWANKQAEKPKAWHETKGGCKYQVEEEQSGVSV